MSSENPVAEEPVNQKDLEAMTRAAPVDPPDRSAPTGAGEGTDEIRLTGVGGIGHHGVLEEERLDGQPFLADLVLTVDTRAAATDDDLTRTVNYAEVAQQVVAVIEGEPVNLIETLAARIAAVVLQHQGVHQATVTVHKPEAPVGVPFTDVEVMITRTRADDLPDVDLAPAKQAAAPEAAAPLPPTVPPPAAAAAPEPAPAEPEQPAVGPDLHASPEQPVPVVIALGGNVGDVRSTLRAVVADLRELPGLSIEDVSPLARTAAVLAPDAVAQPDYLNAVVLATTTLAPMALLESMQALENAYDRQRTVRWGERTLDLDLIVYDGITSTDPELSLPHPRASERAFVLVPWAQAAPDAFLPGLGGGPVAALAETAPDRGGVRWLALDWLEEPVRPAAVPEPAAVPDPAGAPAPAPVPPAPVPPAPMPPAPVPPAPMPPADGAAGAPAAQESPWGNDAEASAGDAPAEPAAPAAPPEEPAAPPEKPAALPEEPAAPFRDPKPASQWAPESQPDPSNHEDLEGHGSLESEEDLELLAHGDAEPAREPERQRPPVVPPAGRAGRASFPPPPEPAPSPPPAPAPVADPGAVPTPEPESEPEPELEPDSELELQPEPEDEPGSWFTESSVPAEDNQRNEPSLPWVTPPEEGQSPRLAPKWQPLRRHDDT